MPEADFEIAALYEALDAQRKSRGLSWQQVTREINQLFAQVPARPISSSTLTGMRSRSVVNGDGVLQMLLWLERSPESFVRGNITVDGSTALRRPEPQQILRFDTSKLFDALNARRTKKGMTWQQVAQEIGGVSPSSLTHLAKGGRTGFPYVMHITRWLQRPAADFTRVSDW